MQTKHIEQIKAALDEIVPVANLGALVSKNDRLQCVKDSLSALEDSQNLGAKMVIILQRI